MKKIVLLAFVLLLLSTAVVGRFIRPVEAGGPIYIRPDGSIEGTTDIMTLDNVTYTFTDNINESIVLERDNIVVDGAGYTLRGTGTGIGINLTRRSNVTIRNMSIKAYWYGVYLGESSNNTISENNITNNEYGIRLLYSSNNSIFRNDITKTGYGIFLNESSDNSISENNITNNRNDIGIYLWMSSRNCIVRNNITSNGHCINSRGISLSQSSNNTLRSNSIANNEYNFAVGGTSLSELINDVDTSNTINGKPVYYWINERERIVPLNAGYVALVNCTSITVQELNITSNGQGVLLAWTTNSTITKNSITHNCLGIGLESSSNNSIYGNCITNNTEGIRLYRSSNDSISGNNITNNMDGIRIAYSSNHESIVGNNITNNSYGVQLYQSSNNIFCRNKFIDNGLCVISQESVNIWDHGYPSGGNYWSGYSGVDLYSGPYQNETGSDGMGDTPYTIDENNRDNYPLMGLFYDFSVLETYHVNIISNSSVSDFEWGVGLPPPPEIFLSFYVAGSDGTLGFCRIIIPRGLMNDTYRIFVSNKEVPYTLLPCSNTTHNYLYFTYIHSRHHVVIVPEFPTWTTIPLLLMVLTVVIAIYKRSLQKTVA